MRATLNVCRANVLAMHAVREQVPWAVFVPTESCEYTHPSAPELLDEARFHNERRFLPLDLSFGRPVSPAMRRYLRANGMAEGEYAFFMNHRGRFRCILGTDYYVTNEHVLKRGGRTGPSGEILGYHALARQYYERYGLPLMHTETNLREEDDAARWLWRQWRCLLALRQEGVPVLGFTWYSQTDQMDWDTALREDARRVNSVGLFDLDRRVRTVGEEYRRLVRDWSAAVPRLGQVPLPEERRAA